MLINYQAIGGRRSSEASRRIGCRQRCRFFPSRLKRAVNRCKRWTMRACATCFPSTAAGWLFGLVSVAGNRAHRWLSQSCANILIQILNHFRWTEELRLYASCNCMEWRGMPGHDVAWHYCHINAFDGTCTSNQQPCYFDVFACADLFAFYILILQLFVCCSAIKSANPILYALDCEWLLTRCLVVVLCSLQLVLLYVLTY